MVTGELLPTNPSNGSDLRDGEPLYDALSQAQQKALAARRTEVTARAEAEKWEAIAAQLQDIVNKSRAPVCVKTRQAAADRPHSGTRKPHGFWKDQIKHALKDVVANGPSKKSLQRELLARFPEGSALVVWKAINDQIDCGGIVFRGPDCLYLPENDPMPRA